MVLSFDQRRAIVLDAWRTGMISAADADKALANIAREERAERCEKVGK